MSPVILGWIAAVVIFAVIAIGEWCSMLLEVMMCMW